MFANARLKIKVHIHGELDRSDSLDVVDAVVASVPEVSVTGVVEKFQGPVPRGEIAYDVNEYTPIVEFDMTVELGRLRAGETETVIYPDVVVQL